jgi:hypothetical protein
MLIKVGIGLGTIIASIALIVAIMANSKANTIAQATGTKV